MTTRKNKSNRSRRRRNHRNNNRRFDNVSQVTIPNCQKCIVDCSDKKTIEEDRPSFFYDMLVLIVSLIHGTFFFVLAERLVNIINDFSVVRLSYLLFYFSLFLRIFQTHILAAVKYTEKWVFRPMDFLLVFSTALFEYLIFYNEEINNCRQEWYYFTIFAFCLFGTIGYLLTYLRTKNDYNGKEKSDELLIQLINIVCVVVVGVLNLFCYLNVWSQLISVSFVNFSSSILLVLNIYLSLRLSKNQLNKIIKV